MWIKMMKGNFADARLGVYVDDRSIRVADKGTLQLALRKTARLDNLLGQELNIVKSYGLATTARARRRLRGLRIGSTALHVVGQARHLGAQVASVKRKVYDIARERVGKARAAIRKIGKNPLPKKAKVVMAGAAGMTKGIFGTSVAALPCPQARAMRTDIIRTCLGSKKPHAAPELITTLLLDPTRHDPTIAADWGAVAAMKRLFARDQGVIHKVERLLARYRENRSSLPS